MKCVFCDIIQNRRNALRIWEDGDFILLLDILPINPGHLLVLPKKHVRDIFDLPEPGYGEIFRVAKGAAKILKELTAAKRIGLAVEGFSVPHVHIHLVPVNHSNELNPLRAKALPAKALAAMHKRFSRRFKGLVANDS